MFLLLYPNCRRQGSANVLKMLSLLHVFGANKQKILTKCGIFKDLAHCRHFRRPVEQKHNLIKVAVVGSGAPGEPSALIVKSCDNFM